MPGIAGMVADRHGIASPQALLAGWQAVYAVRQVNFIYRSFQSATCVITHALTDFHPANLAQPATDPLGDTVLFLDGEIFNQDDLRQQVALPADSSVCDLLLSLYQRVGPDFGAQLNGEFAIVIYEKAAGRLTIISDHLASKPIYYMQQGDALLFGSEKKAILAVSPAPAAVDPVGLLEVFTYEHNLGSRTFVAGLQALTPYI